jgi:hypothetical protein
MPERSFSSVGLARLSKKNLKHLKKLKYVPIGKKMRVVANDGFFLRK